MAAEDWFDEYDDRMVSDDPYDYDPYYGEKLTNCPKCGTSPLL